MKKIAKYITVLVLLLVLGSCENFLDIVPVDRPTFDSFYNNPDELRAGTASLYGYPWFEFNDKFFWLAGDLMSGNVLYTYDQEGQFYYFTHTAGNSLLASGWRSIYRVISYANSVINDVPGVASEKDNTEEEINAAVAEARFVRATAYYFLAEFWGDVPVIDNNTQLVADNNLKLPKNTRSSIYQFIRADLQFAAEHLPTSDPQAGRVTKWSSKGMLAKVFLTMAQNGGSEAAGYFEQARTLAADVIENSGLNLLENYADLFKIAYNNNEESLFALQWMKGGYSLGNSRNANWARSSLIADQQWGGGKGCTVDFQNIVEEGDVRRREIYMSLNDYYEELATADGGYTYLFETENPADPDNPLESPNDVLNHLKKYVVGRAEDNNGAVGTDQDAGNNTYLLRLADVYLIYVEAAMGTGNSTSDPTALQYFNSIRARAGLDAVSSVSWMDLLNERRVEFCLESMFWFDIKRFYYRDPAGALDYLNNQARHHVYRRINGSEDPNLWASYELNTELNDPVVVYDIDMFLPIPTTEIVTNYLLGPDQPAEDFEITE